MINNLIYRPFIVYSVSSSMKLSLTMCCVFSIGNGPWRYWPPTGSASQFALNQYYCYWVPATKASWCDVHQSPVLHLIKCTIHQSPLLHLIKFPFTNLQYYAFYKGCTNLHCCTATVAPFYSIAPFVHYNFVPCDYATRQFCIINNLATDVNMPCRLFNCIVEIKVLNYRTCCHLSTHLFYCRDSASLTSFKSTFAVRSCTTSQFCVLSTADRRPSVDSIQPVYFCIIVSSFLHLLVKYYFLSIYSCTPTIKFIFVCRCVCFYSSLL